MARAARWLRPERRPTPGGSTRAPPTPNGDPPFPVLFDPDARVVLDEYGTQLSPETWILDPDGILRARFDGEALRRGGNQAGRSGRRGRSGRAGRLAHQRKIVM
ncbi:hypothetical protein WMF04_47140 [Sorangium sp. So ce260]|uniref:peroxiredoxin family protein n=1 Tax=Sorangium sp. So ce260 TaxID=3133291 RepID=UPI003F60E52E